MGIRDVQGERRRRAWALERSGAAVYRSKAGERVERERMREQERVPSPARPRLDGWVHELP